MMMMMKTWRLVLCVSVVCGLALDSNTIRSKDNEQTDRSHGDAGGRVVRRRTQTTSDPHRRPDAPCSECDASPNGGCGNRAQRRRTSPVDRQKDGDTASHVGRFNRTKGPEMSSCVRSEDCSEGLCCVRYLTGKRCQRIPTEGEACLRRGSKRRRNLGRCDCAVGLTCAAAGAEPGQVKGQGVCLPRPRQNQRKTRHSGKKRRTVKRSC